jgi:hypothetical protein
VAKGFSKRGQVPEPLEAPPGQRSEKAIASPGAGAPRGPLGEGALEAGEEGIGAAFPGLFRGVPGALRGRLEKRQAEGRAGLP